MPAADHSGQECHASQKRSGPGLMAGTAVKFRTLPRNARRILRVARFVYVYLRRSDCRNATDHTDSVALRLSGSLFARAAD